MYFGTGVEGFVKDVNLLDGAGGWLGLESGEELHEEGGEITLWSPQVLGDDKLKRRLVLELVHKVIHIPPQLSHIHPIPMVQLHVPHQHLVHVLGLGHRVRYHSVVGFAGFGRIWQWLFLVFLKAKRILLKLVDEELKVLIVAVDKHDH